ncbi:hypothetical protein GIB67_005419 [Kingdonia uniflora]|uniref:RING-type E3 ubiquitin transferase n=1 Tax=Kingdonia uniflora TaxID=39325 RepID=A0A7J7NHC7_9MAGN|nr:hypothetical protein GIB67_005419 [Kingdonia uniflora]
MRETMMTMMMMIPVSSPYYAPSPSPSPAVTVTVTTTIGQSSPTKRVPLDFSPPLIAMVVVVATAFFIVTYFRLISRHLLTPILHVTNQLRHRWRSHPSDTHSIRITDDHDHELFETFQFLSPYGLEEEIIKTLPLSLYNKKRWVTESTRDDCAVCLLELEEDDYVRTLPVCRHAFHVDCIDEWLRSHANCPLCRAGIFRPDSPFVPLMAATIRPSLDEGFGFGFGFGYFESVITGVGESSSNSSRITPVVDESNSVSVSVSVSPGRSNGRRDFMLKRSYSFGFERSLVSDRLSSVSPWRYNRRGGGSKRPSASPFSSKQRVFSFRRGGLKSPYWLMRRSNTNTRLLFPLSESNVRSRRSKSLTSPMFMRSSMGFSSRMRCGDLEALLSPDRILPRNHRS